MQHTYENACVNRMWQLVFNSLFRQLMLGLTRRRQELETGLTSPSVTLGGQKRNLRV